MRRMLWIVLTLIVYTTAPQSDGGGQHADQSESQVRKAEEELTSALLRSDVSGLRRMYAEDYVHIGTDGLLSHKPDRITEFATGLRKITQQRREDVQVSIYGNVALVRDIDTVQGSFRGLEQSRSTSGGNVERGAIPECIGQVRLGGTGKDRRSRTAGC